MQKLLCVALLLAASTAGAAPKVGRSPGVHMAGGSGNVTTTGTATANDVTYWTSATAISGENAFTYDPTTDRLALTGIGGVSVTTNPPAGAAGAGFYVDVTTGAATDYAFYSEGSVGDVAILETGYVGIGAPVPSTELHVQHDHNSFTQLLVQNATDGTASQATFAAVVGTNQLTYGQYGDAFATVDFRGRSFVQAESGTSGLDFLTRDVAGTHRWFTITGGIPTQKMELSTVGALSLTATSGAQLRIVTDPASTAGTNAALYIDITSSAATTDKALHIEGSSTDVYVTEVGDINMIGTAARIDIGPEADGSGAGVNYGTVAWTGGVGGNFVVGLSNLSGTTQNLVLYNATASGDIIMRTGNPQVDRLTITETGAATFTGQVDVAVAPATDGALKVGTGNAQVRIGYEGAGVTEGGVMCFERPDDGGCSNYLGAGSAAQDPFAMYNGSGNAAINLVTNFGIIQFVHSTTYANAFASTPSGANAYVVPSTGQYATLGNPSGTALADSLVYINPTGAAANEALFGINGSTGDIQIDAEGDVVAQAGVDFTSTTVVGNCTLSGGPPPTCTATVVAGSTCVCSVVATANAEACSVSLASTTLTIAGATGSTKVVNYHCF